MAVEFTPDDDALALLEDELTDTVDIRIRYRRTTGDINVDAPEDDALLCLSILDIAHEQFRQSILEGYDGDEDDD